jgi:predicted AAA+ superfamily ATPase
MQQAFTMERRKYLQRIEEEFRVAKVVALLGPRQSGKTTLARAYAKSTPLAFDEGLNYFDLEDEAHVARLETPKLALEPLRGLVVIDEIQYRAGLFPLLRVLADRPEDSARFLILGSASRDLIRQGAETLAGRIGFVEVAPFALEETGDEQTLWQRGGFPLSFLAESDSDSYRWRGNYIKTFLERDIPALGIQIPSAMLRRFWMMLAHAYGQNFNASEIGKSLGVADTTVRRYLDILTGTFMIRRLAPWHENLRKRQVKTPKIYFRDSGILHRLLGIEDAARLAVHPRLGASWEGYALEQIIRIAGATEEEAYFWGVHNQGELDLLLFHHGQRRGFEIKYTDAPRRNSSQRLAMECLGLDRLDIVCPGSLHYPLGEKVFVTGIQRIAEQLAAPA